MPDEIRDLLIGFTIVTLFIVGGISVISMFQDDNPGMIPSQELENFNNTFNKFDDLDSTVSNLNSGLQNTNTTDFGTFGVLNSLINSAWQTLRLTVSSFSFITSALGGLSTMFGVPVWAVTILGLIITIIIVYAIFGAIFQR